MGTVGVLPGNKVAKGRNSPPNSLKLRIRGVALQPFQRYSWQFFKKIDSITFKDEKYNLS
jgi:hypothetical protein